MTTTRTRSIGLVGAELLKLRKRRGLLVSTFALTVLPMIVGYAVVLALHASDPTEHAAAGGLENFTDSLEMLAVLAGVAGILVGSTLGSGDLGAGVFRELVVTGRSRWTLFAARIPGGAAFLLPFVLAGFAIAAGAAHAFADATQATPGAAVVAGSAAWVVLTATTSMILALGVSAAFASRGTAIGVLIAWQLAVAPLLLAIGALGGVREALLPAAVQRLRPEAVGALTVTMSLGAAVAIVAAWSAVALAAGGWRTATRDA
jgi:ABC-type transport system involved in multi-copper enzyme maturation permease subunit